MKRAIESGEVIDQIHSATGVPRPEIERIVVLIRDSVDELLADDCSIVAPPLQIAISGDPVYQALRSWGKTATDWEIDTWWELGDDELCSALGISQSQLDAHPIARQEDILGRTLERFGFDLGDEDLVDDPRAQQVHEVLSAWLETFSASRPYLVSDVGLERDFELWLVDNLGKLAEFGFPVSLGSGTADLLCGQQWILRDGRRPDLICRATEDDGEIRVGDWLVIENKATPAYAEAVDQIVGYVEAMKSELAVSGEKVFGLLLTDGAPENVQGIIREAGIDYLSLSALGYRHWRQLGRNGHAQRLDYLRPTAPAVNGSLILRCFAMYLT